MERNLEAPIRILLVDEQEVLRAGLEMLIKTWPNMEVVAQTGDRKQALALTTSKKPDIILVDLESGIAEGAIDYLAELSSVAGEGRTILLTGEKDTRLHQRAIILGAAGVVRKDRAVRELRLAIEHVHSGELWLDRASSAQLIAELSKQQQSREEDPETASLNSLTDREREVAWLVCEGLRNREIGERLFICETTVRHHLSAIFSKLNVASRFELIIYLYRQKNAVLGNPPLTK